MLDRRIRFRHLQCFLSIAEYSSVGRAADALSLTQPAVSKALNEIESFLGVDLFHRESKGMVLTDFGKLFLQHASVSVESLRRGIDDVRAARSDGSAGVSVGVMPNVAGKVLPMAVAQFKSRLPNAGLRIVDGGNLGVLEQLRLGEIDFVVGRLSQPEYMGDVAFEKLYTENIAIVARAGHILASERDVAFSSLQRYPLIYPSDGTNVGQQVRRYLMTHGVKPAPGAVQTTSSIFSSGLVRHSDAIWFVGRGAVDEQIEEGCLVELPLDTSELEGSIGITTRSDSPLTASAETLIDSIRAVCTRLYPSGRNCSQPRSNLHVRAVG